MSKYVTAIDLGTTKVVTIVGELTSIGPKIIGYSEALSSGVMRGEVVNIQRVIDSLMPTIKDAEEQVNREIPEGEYTLDNVFVGIAGQNIRCEANSLKKTRTSSDLISQQEINAMRQEMASSRVAPGETVLHVIPQSYNVEDHIGIPDPVGMMGKEIDGNYRVFIGKANSAAHSEKVIERVGLNLKQLVLEPIASAKAILSKDDMELGVAMVDIGGGTTDLLIYKDNVIRHTAVIPFGGNSITEDIRQICGVSFKHAETLKKRHGSCISDFAPDKIIVIPGLNGAGSKEISYKLLSSAIEARISEIIATVSYEIEKSTYKDKLQNGIVLTGGSSNLNHIQILAKQITGMNVRIAFPDKSITPNSLDVVKKPSASTAVGLVIQGFEYLEEEERNKQIEKEVAMETLFPVDDIPETVKTKPSKSREKKDNEKTKNPFDRFLRSIFEGDNEA